MTVAITDFDFAGVWREAWPTTAGTDIGVVPDLSRKGRHARPSASSLTWATTGDATGRYAIATGPTAVLPTSVGLMKAVACWGVLDNTSANGGIFEQGNTTNGWGVYPRNGNQFIIKVCTGGVSQVVTYVSPVALNDGVRRHWAASWDGIYAKLWIDGVQVSNTAQAVVPVPGPTGGYLGYAGTLALSGAYIWHGTLSDFVLRSTAWTDSEIEWLANSLNDLRASSGSSATPRILSPCLIGDVG